MDQTLRQDMECVASVPLQYFYDRRFGMINARPRGAMNELDFKSGRANLEQLTSKMEQTLVKLDALSRDRNDIPDQCNDYPLCAFMLQCFVPEPRTRFTIAKVIRTFKKGIIVKLIRPTVVTREWMPWIESRYLFLRRDGALRYFMPHCLSIEGYIRLGYVKPKKSTEVKNGWSAATPEPCPICMEEDKVAERYGWCEEFHLMSCADCASKLKECPVCRNTLFEHSRVTFLDLQLTLNQ